MFALLCAAALAKEAPKVQISPRGEVRLDLQATDLSRQGSGGIIIISSQIIISRS